MVKVAGYKTVIIPVGKYGSGAWAPTKAEQNLLERREMRMLRWMLRTKKIEKIRNRSKGRCGKHQ